ncbi:MAG: glycosyltransferase [Cytophagales bacterium]|nr:MAG: glycosyltransferase [Cytophagales bacterium]TAF61000.1 MAG: glycosyltransferase [Cytophagales bacterium]
MPLVSVVTVCFNALDALKRTIYSVHSQSFKDYEYLIVDGASRDGTVQFLSSELSQIYDNERIRWISEPDKGIYDAMNKALYLAKGDYVIFMNAGDIFVSSEVLEETEPFLRQQAAVVYGDYVVQNKYYKELVKAESLDTPWLGMKFCHQSTFIHQDIALHTPFSGQYITSDFEQIYTLFCRGERFLYTKKPIAIFSHDGLSSKNKLKVRYESLEIVQKQGKLDSQTQVLFEKLIKRTKYIEAARTYLPKRLFEWLSRVKIKFFGSRKTIFED